MSSSNHRSDAWLTLRVFLPFVAGYYVSYAFRSMNALLGPHIAAEFDLGAADLGLLTSVYFLAFALAQIPMGVLLDRYGPRRVDAALLLVAAAGAFAFALARSFGDLILGRALVGLGVSVCLMGSFQAFVLWYPKERLATVNSRAFAVGILGAMTVTVPLEMALRVTDWRTIAAFFALATLAASAAVFCAAPERRHTAAPDSLASSITRSIVATSTNGLTASCTATRSVFDFTTASAFSTDCCRLSPPSTTLAGFASFSFCSSSSTHSRSSARTASTISDTRSQRANFRTVCRNIGDPSSSMNCFRLTPAFSGEDRPMRVPSPAAGRITATFIMA